MALNPLLAAGFVWSVMAGLFLLCSVALILVILIQKGRGGGLSGAFGGGMASGILGSKTGDVLTWVTIGMVSFFILVALALEKWWRPTVSGTETQTPAPITSTDTGQPAQPAQEVPVTPAPAPAEKPAPVQ